MRKFTKSKYLWGFIGGMLLVALMVKWIADLPYRRDIPQHPEWQTISKSLKDQIIRAENRAKWNTSADNLGKLGMVYHSCASYDKAAQCYKLAIHKNHSKWMWYYYLGYLSKEMGNADAAIQNFQSAVKYNRRAYMAWYYIGEAYQNQNDVDKAEAAFKQINNIQDRPANQQSIIRADYFPLRVSSKFQLAQAYLNANRIEDAENILNEIIRAFRSYGPAYRLLGSIYKERGNKEKSQHYIDRANDLADFAPPVDTLIDKLALMSRSELYLLKQIDEAERTVYPEYALKLIEQGMNHISSNKYLLSKTIMLHLHLDMGNEITSYLKLHYNLFKDDFNELKAVADLLYEKKLIVPSLIYYKRLAELKPGDAEIQTSLIIALMDLNNKEEAMKLLEENVARYPGDPDILANAVYIMMLAHENNKVLLYMDLLKKHAPINPKTYRLSGIIAEQKGEVDKAIINYTLAFKGNPKDMVSMQSLTQLLIREKKWGLCIDYLRNALEFHRNEPYLLERMGMILVSCPDVRYRDYNLGREYSERAFLHKASPADIMISAGRNLAEAYAALGDKKNANSYMYIIYQLAQSNHAPAEFLKEIEAKLTEFKQ